MAANVGSGSSSSSDWVHHLVRYTPRNCQWHGPAKSPLHTVPISRLSLCTVPVATRSRRFAPAAVSCRTSWAISDDQGRPGSHADKVPENQRGPPRSSRHTCDTIRFMRQSHVWLAAGLAQLGRLDEAHAEAAEVLRIDPKFTIDGTQRRRLSSNASRIRSICSTACARRPSPLQAPNSGPGTPASPNIVTRRKDRSDLVAAAGS